MDSIERSENNLKERRYAGLFVNQHFEAIQRGNLEVSPSPRNIAHIIPINEELTHEVEKRK